MKRVLAGFLFVIVSLMVLSGCANDESEQLKVVRSMMRLDYETMSASDFNAAIVKLCDDAGTTASGVYHDVTEEFTLEGDDYGPPRYNDAELEDFMADTLLYSSIEIQEAHAGQTAAHQNVIMYITVPGMTAKETVAILEGDAEEAMRFAENNAATINLYPLLIYSIEWDIHGAGAVAVSERDSRVNDTHAAIKNYFLSLSQEEAMADALEEHLSAEFERISAARSDDGMTIRCVVDDIARESDLEQ